MFVVKQKSFARVGSVRIFRFGRRIFINKILLTKNSNFPWHLLPGHENTLTFISFFLFYFGLISFISFHFMFPFQE